MDKKIYHSWIELASFERAISKLCKTEDEADEIKYHVTKFRHYGAVVGKHDIRKIRVTVKGRGKRGGARVVYYFTDKEDQIVVFLSIWPKNEKENLSKKEMEFVEKALILVLEDLRSK
jgi:hypothetical protein